jgi:integrase
MRMLKASAQRRAERAARDSTFATIAQEWLTLREHKLAKRTVAKTRWMLETFAFPKIGARPVAQIAAPELLNILRIIELKQPHETAHRTKQLCGRKFRYAIATARAERDPSADLRGALAPIVVTNRAAILDPTKLGALLRAIDGYIGYAPTQFVLKLAPLLFARPGELRAAEWTEFDFAAAEWRIPAARMKMGEPHVVPLAKQAIVLLQDLRPITGDGKYLFPSVRSGQRPISDNTLNAALRRMGYGTDEVTTHGFRSTASTLLNEKGIAPDVIEIQLAHVERNKGRAAYNKAQRLPERRKMMQEWADYLDMLKATKPGTIKVGQQSGPIDLR